MIIYILIIILLIVFIFYSFIEDKHFSEYFRSTSSSSPNNQCLKLNEKCIIYDVGSEDESNNCCSGHCVRKNNNFQYKVCSDKPENICGNFNKQVYSNNTRSTNSTTPSTTLDNSLNGRKKRFCNAAFIDWSLFHKVKVEEEDYEEEENTNLYNPYENISTNKCGIFNFRGKKNSKDTALNRSGKKCNGFFVDFF